MPITCPNCHSIQGDGARFCSNCAAALAAPVPGPGAPPIPPPAPAYSAPIPPPPQPQQYYQPAQPPPAYGYGRPAVVAGGPAARPFPLKLVLALVVAVAVVFAGCNIVSGLQKATGLGSGGVALEAGAVKGHITYADGRPLADAIVDVRNQDYIGGPRVTTDSSGNYSAKAPAGNYLVSAYVQRNWHGKVYHLGLEPQGRNGNFRIENGFVKNFVLRMSGPVPDSANPDNMLLGYWGLPVQVLWEDTSQTDRTNRTIPAGSKIEVTLAPKGSLIDGSTVGTKTYTLGWTGTTYYNVDPLKDIPAGAYTVSAKLSGSASMPLKVNVTAGFGKPMMSSDTLEPTPNEIGISPFSESCCNRMSLYIWPA